MCFEIIALISHGHYDSSGQTDAAKSEFDESGESMRSVQEGAISGLPVRFFGESGAQSRFKPSSYVIVSSVVSYLAAPSVIISSFSAESYFLLVLKEPLSKAAKEGESSPGVDLVYVRKSVTCQL
jgi:hypothetical protein